MAYHNKKYATENLNGPQGLGIAAYDFIQNSYDVNNNLESTEYYRGGLQGSGTLVARVVYTYDGNSNLLTVERTA
jgi:hypothetical protein